MPRNLPDRGRGGSTCLPPRGRLVLLLVTGVVAAVDLALLFRDADSDRVVSLVGVAMLLATALFARWPIVAASSLFLLVLAHTTVAPQGAELLHLAAASGLVVYTTPWRITIAYLCASSGLTVLAAAASDVVDLGGLAALGLVSAASTTIGAALRAAHRRELRLAEDIAQLEHDRESAVAAERARITDELHDIIARDITLISMHVRVLERVDDPDVRGTSHDVIRRSADQALADIRRLLRVMGGTASGEAAAPRPVTVAQALSDVEHELAALGADVSIRQDGVTGASSLVEQTIIRTLREAATNIVKHASPAPTVVIELGVDEHEVRLEVSSSLRDTEDDAEMIGSSGYGLTRLRERALLLGGELEAHRNAEYFVLSTRLPLR